MPLGNRTFRHSTFRPLDVSPLVVGHRTFCLLIGRFTSWSFRPLILVVSRSTYEEFSYALYFQRAKRPRRNVRWTKRRTTGGGETSSGQNVHKAKRPVRRRNVEGAKRPGAKRPGDETYSQEAKRPGGETSRGQNVDNPCHCTALVRTSSSSYFIYESTVTHTCQ